MSQPQQPRGLGKGLEALLGAGAKANADSIRKPIGYINKEVAPVAPQPVASAGIFRVPTESIEPNPYQPRKTFDQDALNELAASIGSLGLIQPITVRRTASGKYQIISGERRFRASVMAGLKELPAYVREADNRNMLEMAIVENIQRENLDPIEVALSYQQLLDECKCTQEEMAGRLGKSRASIANQIRLLKLPVKVQHDIKVGLISVGHAKVLLSVDSPEVQQALCDLTIREGLNVRQLEQKIASFGQVAARRRSPKRQVSERYVKLGERLSKTFGGAVSFSLSDSGRSTMTVRFESDKQLEEFVARLGEKGLE